ncbi:MAG: beta-lactamase family protein [Planctomycetes bacterium]|nr:beta-lactamase family protein [Planctomycetota bacterium]
MQIDVKMTIPLALLLVGASCSSPLQTRISSSAIFEAKSKLSQAIENGEIEGGMVLVHANGEQIMFDVQGCHDKEDQLLFEESSLLRIFSMTKPIASVAAMTLWEQGKFTLDDPVSKYIPSFRDVKVGVVGSNRSGTPFSLVSPKREVNIRDLLSHTSGYSYGNDPASALSVAYASRGVVYWHNGMFPPKMSISKAADLLSQIPLEHEPGERWTYGFNTDIVGALIEVWSGMELGEYLRKSIFKPLGMESTFFDIPEEELDRFTSCHMKHGDEATVIDKWNSSPYREGFEFHSGGGGLTSTIHDYGRFSQMLAGWGKLGRVRIIKKSTLEEMFKNHVPENDPMNFGLGFSIEPVVLGDTLKVPVEQYGWAGYAGTLFKVVPEANLSMVFMRQGIPFNVDFAERLFETVRGGVVIGR